MQNQQQQYPGGMMPMQAMGLQPQGQMHALNQMVQQQAPRNFVKVDNQCTLYVGNLTATTLDNDLFKFFARHGFKLKSAKVMINKSTYKSMCYGYLNFYTQDDALKCLA